MRKSRFAGEQITNLLREQERGARTSEARQSRHHHGHHSADERPETEASDQSCEER